MKSSRIIVWACFCALVMVSPAAATSFQNLLQNGTFEGDGSPWEFVGEIDVDVGVIPPDLVGDLGTFAYLVNSGSGRMGGGYAFQEIVIPHTAATLHLEFDYGFYQDEDAAFFVVGLIGDVSEFPEIVPEILALSVVATESNIEKKYPFTYDEAFGDHFSQSFDVRGDAGGSSNLIFGTLSTSNEVFGVSYIDNVTLTATPIPEPATLLLLGTGIFGLAAYRHRRRNSA